MRSAERIRLTLLLAGAVAPVLLVAACDSTPTENARAQLAAERRLAAKNVVRVTQRTPLVRIEDVTLLQQRGSAEVAVVVDLRSTASSVLTDLPISVGVIRGQRKLLLNDVADLPYFATHIPAVGPRARATWIFAAKPRVRTAAGDIPFVRVGAPARTTTAKALPAVTAAVATSSRTAVEVSVTGLSIPQRDLLVGAVARRGSRPVAAGSSTIELIDRRERATADITLIGRAGSATLTPVVSPTIVQ